MNQSTINSLKNIISKTDTVDKVDREIMNNLINSIESKEDRKEILDLKTHLDNTYKTKPSPKEINIMINGTKLHYGTYTRISKTIFTQNDCIRTQNIFKNYITLRLAQQVSLLSRYFPK